jgi:hypothetical protein
MALRVHDMVIILFRCLALLNGCIRGPSQATFVSYPFPLLPSPTIHSPKTPSLATDIGHYSYLERPIQLYENVMLQVHSSAWANPPKAKARKLTPGKI